MSSFVQATQEHCVFCFDCLFDPQTPVPNSTVTVPLFVSWHSQGKLLGCLGTLQRIPLYEGLKRYALARDYRFEKMNLPQVKSSLQCEVDLLGPTQSCKDPFDWDLTDGLVVHFRIHQQDFSATYLPGVIKEHWTQKDEALRSLIHKAGLSEIPSSYDKIHLKVEKYQGTSAKMTYEEYTKIRAQ